MTKPTKWVCTQQRLCTQWVAKDPRFLHALIGDLFTITEALKKSLKHVWKAEWMFLLYNGLTPGEIFAWASFLKEYSNTMCLYSQWKTASLMLIATHVYNYGNK